jgi:hypothetical protein
MTACRGRSHDAFVAHGPLPPPPPGPLKFAGAPPEHPFHKEPGNVFERTIFQTDGPNSSRIEIRDLLVPPRTKSQIAALPGPAVLEIATGTATMSLGEKPESIVSGAMRSVPGGKPVQVENPDDHPAILRLYVIQAR